MTTTVDAIYEHGKLVLPQPLSLPEKSRVRVTIESDDAERENWLKLSEASLLKTWGNDADDVFNELLKKLCRSPADSVHPLDFAGVLA